MSLFNLMSLASSSENRCQDSSSGGWVGWGGLNYVTGKSQGICGLGTRARFTHPQGLHLKGRPGQFLRTLFFPHVRQFAEGLFGSAPWLGLLILPKEVTDAQITCRMKEAYHATLNRQAFTGFFFFFNSIFAFLVIYFIP